MNGLRAGALNCVDGPLRGFSLRASIDWIDFEVTLASPSQFRHVQDRAQPLWGRLYVQPLEQAESCRRFRIRAHNPAGPDDFMHAVQALAQPGQTPIQESDIAFVAMEVAIDAYIQDSPRERLADATIHFITHLATLPAGAPRITARKYWDADLLRSSANDLRQGVIPGEKIEASDPTFDRALVREALLSDGATINQGKPPQRALPGRAWSDTAPGDNLRARFYIGTYDTQDGEAYKPLAAAQHSARMELTLSSSNQKQAPHLPFATIAQWREFRFERLARSFGLVMIKPGLAGLSRAMLEAHLKYAGQLGRPASPEAGAKLPGTLKRGIPDPRRAGRASTVKDTVTNAAIYDALRALTKRNVQKFRKQLGQKAPGLTMNQDGGLLES